MARRFLAGVADELRDDDHGPGDFGWLAWSGDPALMTVGTAAPNGNLSMTRLVLRAQKTITRAHLFTTGGGATLTNVGVALYSAAGALLASAVNTAGATTSAFQLAQLQTITFATPQTIGPGPFYVAHWFTGTTPPSLLRGAPSGTIQNAGTTLASGTGLRFAVANTGLTTAAPATATQTGNAASAFWAAVS